ncbi:MAG: hypothetical protein U0V75_06760 [Ferruginibacter sp.]
MANHCWPLAIKPKELKRLRDQKLGVEQKLMIIFRAGKKATKQIWKTDCPALRLRRLAANGVVADFSEVGDLFQLSSPLRTEALSVVCISFCALACFCKTLL